MFRTTLRSAWSRKRRMIGTMLAIVVGVAFLSATLVLGDSARAGFQTAFDDAVAGTDVYVRSSQGFTAAEETARPPIDAAMVEVVAGVEGVSAVSPDVEGVGQVLDADGDPIGGNGPPTMAWGWVPDPDFTGWELAEGRAPGGAGEVVIDRATADEAGAALGDALTVLVPEPIEVTVVGIATFGDDDSIGGSTYVAFTMEEAQQLLLGGTDRVTAVLAAGADGLAEEELVDRVDEVLPQGVEAITGTELADELQEDIEGDFLGFFTTALTAFALVALLVAAFSIFNTFSILVAQRTRESALLRALGASRRQILVSALAESVVVGIVGAALGAAAGVFIASGALALMEGAGFGMPTDGVQVTSGSLGVSAVAGLAVTLIGGVVPAWRASRVAPLAALRESAVDTSSASRLRAVAGALTTAAGVLLVLTAGGTVEQAGVGAVVMIAGMVVLGPVVARPVGYLLGAPLRLRGVTGQLARRNAVRNPGRTAATATALLIGVGVVSLFTVFGASVSASIEQQVDRTFGGELALTPAGSGFSGAGIAAGVIEEIDALPEVEAATGLGFGAATVDGRQDGVGFSEPEALATVADVDVSQGSIAKVGDTDVAMSDEYAGDHGYEIGDLIEFGFPDGETESLTLAATFDARAIGGDIIVPEATWSRHAPQVAYFIGLVGLADGVSLDEGRAAVESVTSGAGAPDVMDRQEFIESQAAEIDVLLTVIYALLGVAIVIALMGIANTISLSVFERTRELGLLRAVGQSRSQLRAMVRWESVIVAVFGSVGGLAIGMFLGWGLVQALNEAEGFGEYAVPYGSLLAVLLVGATVGVLAGLRPAWRASKLDVLDAVATE